VDRQDFLKTLAEACPKTDWRVHAYCLMSNHFQVVLETPNANLVEGMHWLLSTYTIRLNRRQETPGHVFSGRYKALVVEGENSGYLKTVCDYVPLNPVRAHILRPEERLLSYTRPSAKPFISMCLMCMEGEKLPENEHRLPTFLPDNVKLFLRPQTDSQPQ
jgi:REP element-mobilizing transposase RayT